MSFDRLTARGAGKLAWRASVEGWPYEFVSHRDMVQPIKKDGLTGWSASNYLSQGATAVMPGSSTMTRSIYFVLDTLGTFRVLAEHEAGTSGWVIFIGASNILTWRLYDAGGTSAQVTSAALTSGTPYVATMSYDGTARLVVNQTASTPVTDTFVPAASGTAALGSSSGNLPATGVTILGFAATDQWAPSADAPLQAHNARVSALGEMVNLLDGEHLYKAPDLSTDLVGSANWTVNGRLRVATVDAVTGLYGRKRIAGLKSDGFEFREKVDPVTAKWEADGFSVILAGGGRQKNNDAAQAFKGPTKRTYLTGDLSAAGTTINVQSTSAFPNSGVVHIDTEAIYYAAKSATQFTGLVRGIWGTQAQAHYADDGTETARSPEVTDWPRSVEGRRVKLYAYGAGDSKQGDGGNSGEPIWFGVAATGPRFDGVNWTFMVDGPSKLLDGKVGADIGDGLPIRGIYYHEGDPLVIFVYESATTSLPILGGSTAAAATAVVVTGFWESQADFVADLTASLQDAVINHPFYGSFTAAAQGIRAVIDGERWAIEWTTASSSPVAVLVTGIEDAGRNISRTDGRFGRYPYDAADEAKTSVGGVSASTTYRYQLIGDDIALEARGTEPRASVGINSATALGVGAAVYTPDRIYKKDGATWPNGRLYLGGVAPISSSITRATLGWDANGTGVSADAMPRGSLWEVDSVDTSNRYIQLDEDRSRLTGPHMVATSENIPTIAVGIKYATGTLANFLDEVTDLWAANINKGAVPDLRNDDVDLTGDSLSAIESAALSTAYTSTRRFLFATEEELRDVVEHECRLLGVHPAMIGGKIGFRKLRVPSPSEANDSTLTATDILTDDGFLAYEQGQYALWNSVEYKTGYDGKGDHNGDTIYVRDMDAFGASPRPRQLSVAPLSQDPSGMVDHADLRKLAGRVLGTYGGDYAILTVAVPLSKWSVSIGDAVAVTWSKVPDELGDLGVTTKLGIVLSREWSVMEGRGVFEILLSRQRVGGYVPSAVISASSGSGTGWNVDITATNYLPTGTSGEDWWTAGDKIRVYRWDSATAGTVTGTVTGVVGNTFELSMDSTWTPGANTWVLSGAVSTSISAATQKVYVYIARTDGRVHWASSETDDAFTMAT